MTTSSLVERPSPGQPFTPFLFGTCLSVIFLILLNFSVTNMASTYIIGDLGGSDDTAAYTISLFGIGNVLTLPLALPLRNRFGIRLSINVCMIAFLITSFFTAFSPNYPMFLAFRFLQGAASGPIFILLTTLVSTIATEGQRAYYFRDVLMTFVIAPALAASLGGFLAYELHWSWIFFIDAFLIAIGAMLLGKQLTTDAFPEKRLSFDFIGYVLFFLSILPLGLFFVLGQELDWFRSALNVSFFVIGMGSLILFVYWVWNHPNPILKLRLLKNFAFSFSVVYLAMLFSLYFGMVILISLWLNLYVNYTVTWVSVGIGSMVLSAFVMVFAIRGSQQSQRFFFLTSAISFLLISSIYTAGFNEFINFERIAISRVIAGFGIALFLPPLFHLMLKSCSEEDHLNAITVFQFTRALSSSLGAAVYTTLWQRRFYFYYDRMGSLLTEFSQKTEQFYQKAKGLNFTIPMTNAELSRTLDRQARSLALNDCFYLMSWILGALLVFLIIRLCVKGYRAWRQKDLYGSIKER